jgi:hypothetical protein
MITAFLRRVVVAALPKWKGCLVAGPRALGVLVLDLLDELLDLVVAPGVVQELFVDLCALEAP